jgi:hypothetical protein
MAYLTVEKIDGLYNFLADSSDLFLFHYGLHDDVREGTTL